MKKIFLLTIGYVFVHSLLSGQQGHYDDHAEKFSTIDALLHGTFRKYPEERLEFTYFNKILKQTLCEKQD